MMRTKQQLMEFDNIALLLQYLYMGYSIEIINIINVRLTIRMNPETCGFEVENKNFPELGFKPFTDQMTVPVLLDIVKQLKEKPSNDKEHFESKWDEIKTITALNLSLNK